MALNSFIVLATPVLFLFLKLFKWGRRDTHLPPGPPTSPIVGNILQFPKAHLQLQFTEWALAYGDIFSVKVFNSTMIVLSSPAAVRAVLDKKGNSTGGRPRNLMWSIFQGLYLSFENAETEVWRRGRKIMHRFLGPESVQHQLPVQEAEATQLVNDLLDDPLNIYTHIMRTTFSVMASLLYGKRIPTSGSPDMEAFFEGVKLLNAVNDATAFPLVEIVPFVDYIPKWLAPWSNHVEKTKSIRNALYYRLLEEAEEKLQKGHHTGSYVEDLLQNQAKLGISRDELAYNALVLMDWGVETVTSLMQNAILALVAHPECQKKAQEEMDRVVGAERMPTLADYKNLPYLRAFMEELQRFRPLFPLAIPHMATEDLSYNDYLIPKGSLIFQNTYGIFHDPDSYDQPEIFRPERFLESQHGTKKENNAFDFRDNIAFGSGRRICPGDEVAHRSIAINIMNIIWAFDLSAKEKMTLELKNYIVPGIQVTPKPFACSAIPRDADREKLVRSPYLNSQKD